MDNLLGTCGENGKKIDRFRVIFYTQTPYRGGIKEAGAPAPLPARVRIVDNFSGGGSVEAQKNAPVQRMARWF